MFITPYLRFSTREIVCHTTLALLVLVAWSYVFAAATIVHSPKWVIII